MTADEAQALAEIHQLLARCAQAGDTRKADLYSRCFTVDGVLQLKHETVTGRNAIEAWMRAPSPIPPPADAGPGFVSHHLTTCHVDFDGPENATARTYWLVISTSGLDHSGFYADHLHRAEGAWLLARRRPRTLWISPTSVLHRR